MEDYRLEQSGQEVQDILNGAAMQVDLTAETERAELAETTLQGNIDVEERDRKDADLTLQGNIDAEELRAKAAEKQNADDIDALEEKVPSGASASNKLATEEYVDDSVATATATFRGTYNLVSDLHLTVNATEQQIATALALAISTADNNDYCFILVPTSSETPTEIKEVDRYKFNGTAWSFEYKLNNSGFTAAQWDAINSGITSGDVTKLAALPTNAELTTLLNGKQDVLTFDNVPTEGSSRPVKSGGVYSAIDDEKTARENADSSLSSAIEAILLLIPSAATSLNKLADKAFVNSSIATASATFRGTYNLVTDLSLTVSATHAQIATALAGAVSDEDNNDYAFVQIPTSDATPTQIAKTERYKYNGTIWEYEYDLNNSGYTAAQWAAINSGITEALVTKLSALPTNTELTSALGVLTSSITTINQKIPNAASQANQLVDTAAMESYIVQVLDVLTASFNVTSTDGHVTVSISQVDGKITSVAVSTSDIASASDLSLIAGRVTTAEGNISTNAADIANLQDAYAALTQSALVVVQPTDTWPVANPATSTIYRVVDRVNTPPQYYSDYMWNGSVMVLMATYDNAIDPRPKKASQNLVTSGGVFDNMGALDISELNATENPHTLAPYSDLSAALAAVPTDYQKGGMSIKFVQSSDNNYVQYRLKANAFSTTVSDWVNVEKTIDERVLKSISDVVSYGPYITTDGSNDMNKLKPNIMVQAVNLQMSNSPVSTMNGFIISGDCTNQSDNHGRFQIYMQTYGAYYIRYNWTYDGSWTNWLYGDSVNSLKSVASAGYISDVSAYTTDGSNNVNNLKKNTVVGLFNSTASNTPYSPNFSGQIITIGSFVEQNYSKIQIATNGDKFWFRYNLVYDGTYGNWINLNNNFAGNSGYLATLNSITTNGTDDADKLPPYIMVGLIGANSAHLPVSNMNGWLMSISGTDNGTYGNIQMAFANGNVYYRYNYSYDGAYSGWENLTRIYSYVNYCSTFLKVALVGDSITEGLMPKMDGTFVSNGNYSWGNLLFTRATVQNTAQAGATAKTYLTDATLSARLQNLDNKTEIVVIYLGTNQIIENDSSIPIGTDADIVANWNDTNVNTYYGWYSKLYKTIRHYTNEYCPIVVLGKFDNPYQAMYQDCATKCGCLFINLNTYGNLYYKLPNNNDGNHFTSAGYAGVAKAIEFGLNECIENNPTAFNKTAQILSL